jgi:flagellar biosynthesis anti-sigma factor FlgM
MRISNTNQAEGPMDSPAASALGAHATSSPLGGLSLPEDHATLSGAEASVASLTAQLMAASSARASRVDTLRQAVQNGDYEVDAEATAQAMIEESF